MVGSLVVFFFFSALSSPVSYRTTIKRLTNNNSQIHSILWQQNSFALNCSSWQSECIYPWLLQLRRCRRDGGRCQHREPCERRRLVCDCRDPAWSCSARLLARLSRSCLLPPHVKSNTILAPALTIAGVSRNEKASQKYNE